VDELNLCVKEQQAWPLTFLFILMIVMSIYVNIIHVANINQVTMCRKLLPELYFIGTLKGTHSKKAGTEIFAMTACP
jgi:hypothetical protein